MSTHPQPAARDPAATLARAQRLRLRRVLVGCASHAFTSVIVACCWQFGYLDGIHVAAFVAAALLLSGATILTVHRGWNLRLRDPSMAAPMIVAAVALSVYVMYFVEAPMLRAPYLLMAGVALLFGALTFDLRRLLPLVALLLLSYPLLLVALYFRAPERVDVSVEFIVALAYAMVLTQVTLLASYINGLRRSLREKNSSLRQTMEELKVLATRDPLTRLPNRRTAMQALEDRLTAERRRQPDAGASFCVGLLDLDHFKQINDRFGHATGDRVLQEFAVAGREVIRETDTFGRWGGEEFLIVLPDTTLDIALGIVERIREAAARLGSAPEMKVSLSAGLATNENDPARLEDIVASADAALYQAKEDGRDAVRIAQESYDVASTGIRRSLQHAGIALDTATHRAQRLQ